MSDKITLSTFQLFRMFPDEGCGHTWWPRTPEHPAVCPSCKSPYWDKPRKPHKK